MPGTGTGQWQNERGGYATRFRTAVARLQGVSAIARQLVSVIGRRTRLAVLSPQKAAPWPAKRDWQRIEAIRQEIAATGQEPDTIEIAVGLGSSADPFSTRPVFAARLSACDIEVEEVGAAVELLVAAIQKHNEGKVDP